MTGLPPLDNVLYVIRRQFWLIAVIVILGCAASVWFALSQERVYQAVASMQIRGPLVEEDTGGAARNVVGDQLDLIERRIFTRDTMTALIEDFGLFGDASELSMAEKVALAREAIELRQIENDRPASAPDADVPAGITIFVRLDDSETAAAIANELMGDIVAAGRRGLIEQARTAEAFFNEEETRITNEIEALESEITDFKRANAAGLPENIASLRDQLSALRDAELELDREILALETNQERQREEVLDRQRALLENQRRLLGERIAEIEDTFARAPLIEQEYSALTRELAQLQTQFELVTGRRSEAEMTRILEDRQNAEIFEVLETAEPPEYPVSRSRRAVAMAGGVASVVAAGIVVAILEFLNPAIRTAAQLERSLEIRPVVTIPTVRTRGERRRRWIAATAGLVLVALGVPTLLRMAAQQVPSLRPLAERLPGLPQG